MIFVVLVTLGPRIWSEEHCSGAGGQIGFTSIPVIKSFANHERHINTGLASRAYNPEYLFHCQRLVYFTSAHPSWIMKH